MSCHLRIGLTGGIGSGKSEVSRLFAERGAPVIDTDLISRELVEPGQAALREIVEAFGAGILDPDGRLNRDRLRSQVFADPDKHRRLEAILHPRIRDRALERAETLEAPYCLLVIPLLVETRGDYPLDRILVVDTPREKQFERVVARDGLPRPEIEAIMRRQASREQRLALADDVILNDAGLDHLETEVARLDRRYRQLAEN